MQQQAAKNGFGCQNFRLCLPGGNYSSIVAILYTEKLIYVALPQFCYQIRPTDRGPQSICDKCLECVNNWYEFNEVCHVSNALLTKFLNVASDVSKKNINQVIEYFVLFID